MYVIWGLQAFRPCKEGAGTARGGEIVVVGWRLERGPTRQRPRLVEWICLGRALQVRSRMGRALRRKLRPTGPPGVEGRTLLQVACSDFKRHMLAWPGPAHVGPGRNH